VICQQFCLVCFLLGCNLLFLYLPLICFLYWAWHYKSKHTRPLSNKPALFNFLHWQQWMMLILIIPFDYFSKSFMPTTLQGSTGKMSTFEEPNQTLKSINMFSNLQCIKSYLGKLKLNYVQSEATVCIIWYPTCQTAGYNEVNGITWVTVLPLSSVTTRKPSCRWQTRATLAKSLHGLRKSSGVVSCIARLPIDSVPMVSYYVLYSNCVCKMRHFGDTRLLKLPW